MVEGVSFHRDEKKLLCQWINAFMISASQEPEFDPVDFAFMRFALNMAFSADKTPVEVMLDAGVPSFLTGMLYSPNQGVTGPAALALVHLSLYDDLRVPIADSGAIPAMTHIHGSSG